MVRIYSILSCLIFFLVSCNKEELSISISSIQLPVQGKVRAIEQLNGHIFIGGGNKGEEGFVLESNTDFTDFTLLNATLKYPIHGITYDHFRYVFTAEDVEIYYSVDLNEFTLHWYKPVNWVEDHNKQPSREIKKAPDGTGHYLVSGGELQFGLIQHSPDSFGSWLPYEFDHEIRTIDFSPKGVGLAAGNGILLRKEIGSTSWGRQRLNHVFITDLEFIDETRVVAAMFNGSFLHSDDGGLTFNQSKTTGQTIRNPLFVSAITHLGNGNLIGVGPKGSVFTSYDYGKSWKGQRKVSENLEVIYPLTQTEVVVGGDSGKLFRLKL